MRVHILENFTSSSISSLVKKAEDHLYFFCKESPTIPPTPSSIVFRSTALPTTTRPQKKIEKSKTDIFKDQTVFAVFFSCLFICLPPSLMEHHLLFFRLTKTKQDAQVCQTLAQIHHLLPCNVSNWPLLHDQRLSSRYETLWLE